MREGPPKIETKPTKPPEQPKAEKPKPAEPSPEELKRQAEIEKKREEATLGPLQLEAIEMEKQRQMDVWRAKMDELGLGKEKERLQILEKLKMEEDEIRNNISEAKMKGDMAGWASAASQFEGLNFKARIASNYKWRLGDPKEYYSDILRAVRENPEKNLPPIWDSTVIQYAEGAYQTNFKRELEEIDRTVGVGYVKKKEEKLKREEEEIKRKIEEISAKEGEASAIRDELSRIGRERRALEGEWRRKEEAGYVKNEEEIKREEEELEREEEEIKRKIKERDAKVREVQEIKDEFRMVRERRAREDEERRKGGI